MVTAPVIRKAEVSEPELLIEEFKQKLTHSLHREKEIIRELADNEAKLILSKAYQESTHLLSQAQEESNQIISQAKDQAQRKVDLILSLAQEKADQIINKSEESSRKVAKENTRKEVDLIIRNTREEAAKQSARTLQMAKAEANIIVVKATKAAAEITQSTIEMKEKATLELAEIQKATASAIEQALASARKSAVETAEKEAAEMVSHAKARAHKERELLLANTVQEAKHAAGNEAAQILNKARLEAESIITAAKIRVRTQIEESSRLMLEIQQKMQQVIEKSEGEAKNTTQQPAEITPPPVVPQVPVLIKEASSLVPVQQTPVLEKENLTNNDAQSKIKAIFYDEEKRIYSGRLKIDITPPADIEQLAVLEQHMSNNHQVRTIVKGGAEDGSAWIEIEMAKPVPLLEILRNIPSVKDVVGAKSYIIIALKSKQPV